MRIRLVTVACVVGAIGLVGAFAFARNAYTAPDGQVLAPFECRPEGATSPETAAQAMFLGVATASPRDFGKHVLLGVCNNEVGGGWYAMPRCRSSKNFYAIADAMSLAHTDAKEAK